MSTLTSPAPSGIARRPGISLVANGCLVAIWFAAMITAALTLGSAAHDGAEAVSGVALLAFVVLHTLTLYRPIGAVGYFALAVTVAFGLEACSVATGFPFGFYIHHLDGPRALGVPLTVVAGWVVLAWVAWNLARVIVGEGAGRRLFVVATPVVATLILGGYDLVIDPIGAYVRGMYSYGSPSGALGVPLNNYSGWVITGWILFQIFAVVEWRWRREPTGTTRAALFLPAVIWFGLGLQVNLEILRIGDATTTIRGTSIAWADIYQTCVASTWFTMGLVVAVSVVRFCTAKHETA